MEFIAILVFIVFLFLIFYFSFGIGNVSLYDFSDFEEVLNRVEIVIDDNCKLFFWRTLSKKERRKLNFLLKYLAKKYERNIMLPGFFWLSELPQEIKKEIKNKILELFQLKQAEINRLMEEEKRNKKKEKDNIINFKWF